MRKTENVAASSEEASHPANVAFESLRGVLQSMQAEQRQVSIGKMSERTRSALLKFMASDEHKSNVPLQTSAVRKGSRPLASVSSRPLKSLPVKRQKGRGYFAQMDIGFLRIYARGQRDVQKAIEHQIILSQIRDAMCAVVSTNHEAWKDASRIQQIIEEVVLANGCTASDLDLRTCVQMRATEYVQRKYVVTSPVMPIAKALALRAHLVSARSTSWESFRTEWIKVMRSTRFARSKNLSQKHAEEVVNKAREEFLDEQIKLATRSVEKILAVRENAAQKRRFAKAALGIQKKGRSWEHQMWKERMMLWLQRELSAEEMCRFSKMA